MHTWPTIIISSGGSKKYNHTTAHNLKDRKYKRKSGFCYQYFFLLKVW